MANAGGRRGALGSQGLLALTLLALAFLTALVSIFGPALPMVEEHHAHSMDIRIVKKATRPIKVALRNIVHEALLHRTVKECLPSQSKTCKTFVRDPINESEEKVERIALISPPGTLASSLRTRMDHIAEQHNQRHDRKDPGMAILGTPHVPPYGYGKSHGLTKIVKVMPRPLLLQVTDALRTSLEPPQTFTDLTWEDVKVGLLQIMRFHCRLSHVAAHTASLTISISNLLNTTELTESLQDFMTPKDQRKANPALGDDLSRVDEDVRKLLLEQETVGSQILSHIAGSLPAGQDFWAELDRLLVSELTATKNMTVWPCPSFWSALPAPLQLSPVTRRLARALSPACSDPYVKCFIKKDLCEAAEGQC
jgi:hypothetical protein